ncbi:MAG: sulfurtransferase TusA family protein, partial [Myxococcales bacterium]|nr:sulfurtransferase TusA family protein [Myxococcales bacterium]
MTQTIDCRGQKCPEPVLRTARAARQLSNVGGTFEVLADDDAFPADVRSWCRSSGATLVALDDVSGAHRAVIQVLKKHDATPTSPATPG